MMMMSEKLIQRPSPSSSGRLFLLVLVTGLAVAMVLSMVFAGDAQAKKKKNKKKTSAQHAIAAPGTALQKPPPNVYQGDSVARAWGYNGNGQLGDGTTTNRSTPVGVSNLSGVKAIAGGDYHSVALKEDGTVWAWGWNVAGQLGDGTTTDRNTAVKVSNLSGVKAIAGGDLYNLVLKEDGTVWAWGQNYSGQLGDGTTTDRNMPVQVSNLSGVKAIAGGGNHSLALKVDGTVWAWGNNLWGQLGNGTSGPGTSSNTPVQVSNLSGVKAIDAEYEHSLVLKEDGTVWTWGKNDHAQLGDGTTTNRNTPVQVSNAPLTNAPPNNAFSSTQVGVNKLSGVKAIAGGDHHSLALKEDGTVWAWGENDYAQLGNGTNGYNTLSKTPVQVSNLGSVTAIAGARWHNLALKTDGTVWAWGENDNNELGDGTTTTVRSTPVQVSNLGNVTAIAASGHHSLAKVLNPPTVCCAS